MGMRELLDRITRLFRPSLEDELDGVLDGMICDALLEERVAQAPENAWERLFKTIAEGRVQRQGMWVLDEPLRDPPVQPRPRRIFDFGARQHVGRLPELDTGQRMWQVREAVWDTLLPTFSSLVNW